MNIAKSVPGTDDGIELQGIGQGLLAAAAAAAADLAERMEMAAAHTKALGDLLNWGRSQRHYSMIRRQAIAKARTGSWRSVRA